MHSMKSIWNTLQNKISMVIALVRLKLSRGANLDANKGNSSTFCVFLINIFSGVIEVISFLLCHSVYILH